MLSKPQIKVSGNSENYLQLPVTSRKLSIMKKALKVIVVVLFVAFVAIQFYRPDMTNPAVVAGQNLEATTQVPENVEQILMRSCNDCHTNTTVYPWYSKISPTSWFLANHIKDGRQHLNFSEWTAYETSRRRRKLDQVCEQAQTREMPLPSYLWIHWGSKLSDDEIKTLCDWTKAENVRLESSEAK